MVRVCDSGGISGGVRVVYVISYDMTCRAGDSGGVRVAGHQGRDQAAVKAVQAHQNRQVGQGARGALERQRGRVSDAGGLLA